MTIADDRPEDPDAPIGAAHSLPPATVYRWGMFATLGVLTVVAGVLLLYQVRAVLVQIVIALFIAVSLDPAVRFLIRRGVRRSIAVTVIFVLTLGLLVAFVWSLVPPLVSQGTDLASRLPEYVQQLPEKSRAYREIADRYNLTQTLSNFAKALPGRVGNGAIAFLRQFLGALVNALLVIVLTIYFMADLPRLRRGLVRLFPRQLRPRVAQGVNVVVDKVGGYMIGNLIISLFAGVSSFICLFALDVPFALPLALFVAITDLIPMIGATFGAVVCTFVALFTAGVWPGAIVVGVFFMLYQQLENYLIAPRVLRNTVDLSSVAVLLAALLGAAVLGLIGALMAIPFAAAIKVLMTPMVESLNERPPERADLPPAPIEASIAASAARAASSAATVATEAADVASSAADVAAKAAGKAAED